MGKMEAQDVTTLSKELSRLTPHIFEIPPPPHFTVNVLILVLLAVAFLIVVQRNLLNLSDFLHKEKPGMFPFLRDAKSVRHQVHCFQCN